MYRLSADSNASAVATSGAVSFCNQTFAGSLDGTPLGACSGEVVALDEQGCAAFNLPPFEAAVVVQPIQ